MTPTSQLSAIKHEDRIQTLDIMRGIVLFGILLMNINGMGLGMEAYFNPTVSGGDTKWDLYTWMATNLFFEGTMRELFSMLFGVGMFVLLDHDAWDVLSVMLLGIALFKWNLLSGKKSYRFYTIMAVVGYVIGLTVNYYELRTILDSNFAPTGFSKANITYDLGRIPTAMGHVALIMIFCKLPVLNWLKTALAAVGKMALTNYIMHSVIALFLFTGAGFGLFGKLQRHELLYVVFAIWVFQLILSPIWLTYFQFGPLEWGWRNLSYLKKHEIRKKPASATGPLLNRPA